MSSPRSLQLPSSRVKTIMKSSPGVDQVGIEPVLLVTKLTELFVADLAKRAYEKSGADHLDYKHIANLVKEDDTLDFLREILPCKITVNQFKELTAQKKRMEALSDSDNSYTSSEEENKSST